MYNLVAIILKVMVMHQEDVLFRWSVKAISNTKTVKLSKIIISKSLARQLPTS